MIIVCGRSFESDPSPAYLRLMRYISDIRPVTPDRLSASKSRTSVLLLIVLDSRSTFVKKAAESFERFIGTSLAAQQQQHLSARMDKRAFFAAVPISEGMLRRKFGGAHGSFRMAGLPGSSRVRVCARVCVCWCGGACCALGFGIRGHGDSLVLKL